MYTFKNIDSYKPGRFERVGMLKGKRWYTNIFENNNSQNVLFKPKRLEFGDRHVFCANHYGEFVFYELVKDTSVPICPVSLARLSKYFPHIHKERNGGTPIEKDGCISCSLLGDEDILEAGSVIMNKFEDFKNQFESEDDLELFLKTIELRTKNFYKEYYGGYRKFLPEKYKSFAKNELSEEYILDKIEENRKHAIQMIVVDCLYGNNDRHSDNWSMVQKVSDDKVDIELYPLYDNERAFGLYENQRTIEQAIRDNNVEEISEKMLFSRMSVPGEEKKRSTYKDVLKYLMEHYPEETEEALKEQLQVNKPQKVKRVLELCEGLPQCYIDFGTKMYEKRYDFAKELITRHKNQENKDMQKSIKEIDFPYFRMKIPANNKTRGYAEEIVK